MRRWQTISASGIGGAWRTGGFLWLGWTGWLYLLYEYEEAWGLRADTPPGRRIYGYLLMLCMLDFEEYPIDCFVPSRWYLNSIRQCIISLIMIPLCH